MFPTPDRQLENVATWNFFLHDLQRLFFFFGYRKSWLEVPILFQNLRSELVYTFKWTKSVARLWRNQICEWTLKKKKTNPLTYRPIGEMEGRVRETNIFLRVALTEKLKSKSYQKLFLKCQKVWRIDNRSIAPYTLIFVCPN